MKKTETQQVLDALKLLDPELSFSDWENGDGEDIGPQLCAAAALLQADLARVMEPVAYCVSLDGKTVYSNLSCDREYVERMRDVVGGTAQVMALYATPQEAAAPDLLEALKYARRMVNASECDIAFIDSVIAKATP